MSKPIQSIPTNNIPILYFDGGSRGNPGEAAGGAVIIMPDNQRYEVSQFLELATNNEAEYTGLIIGLKKAKELGIETLVVKGDSQLVINQIKGFWKVNSPHLKELYQEVYQLLNNFKTVTFNWVRREENKLADSAVNQCLDRALGIENQPLPEASEELNSSVAKLINLGAKARFKDYVNLKSGRDEFSSKGLLELQKMIPEAIQKEMETEGDGNARYLAKVYRWYLRGLPVNMALKKVRVDAEIEEKSQRKTSGESGFNNLS